MLSASNVLFMVTHTAFAVLQCASNVPLNYQYGYTCVCESSYMLSK